MDTADAIRVGDKMRICLDLVERIQEDPTCSSILIRVAGIRQNPDGTKDLVVERAR